MKLITSNYKTIHAAKQKVIIIDGQEREYTGSVCGYISDFGAKIHTLSLDSEASEITCTICQKNLAKES